MTEQEAEFTVSGFNQWVKGGFIVDKGKKIIPRNGRIGVSLSKLS
jgi:hypothetical protein